jgi:hypothetical protein
MKTQARSKNGLPLSSTALKELSQERSNLTPIVPAGWPGARYKETLLTTRLAANACRDIKGNEQKKVNAKASGRTRDLERERERERERESKLRIDRFNITPPF